MDSVCKRPAELPTETRLRHDRDDGASSQTDPQSSPLGDCVRSQETATGDESLRSDRDREEEDAPDKASERQGDDAPATRSRSRRRAPAKKDPAPRKRRRSRERSEAAASGDVAVPFCKLQHGEFGLPAVLWAIRSDGTFCRARGAA